MAREEYALELQATLNRIDRALITADASEITILEHLRNQAQTGLSNLLQNNPALRAT